MPSIERHFLADLVERMLGPHECPDMLPELAELQQTDAIGT